MHVLADNEIQARSEDDSQNAAVNSCIPGKILHGDVLTTTIPITLRIDILIFVVCVKSFLASIVLFFYCLFSNFMPFC